LLVISCQLSVISDINSYWRYSVNSTFNNKLYYLCANKDTTTQEKG